MVPIQLDADTIEAGLRALKTVAIADETLDPHERALIDATAAAWDVRVDVDDLDVIGPHELAAAVDGPLDRLRLVQAMLLMSLMDGKTTQDELDTVHAFARAMHIDEAELRSLRQQLREVLDVLLGRKRLDDLRAQAGFDLDTDGQIGFISFLAGYRKRDPFPSLLALGMLTSLFGAEQANPERVFDPDLVIPALSRGAAAAGAATMG